MKILFKNKTKYTKTAYNKFLQFHQNKYGLRYKFNTIIIILLLCFCFITNLKYSNFNIALIFFISLILYCFNRFAHPVKIVKKELKTEKFEKEKEFTFTFYENFLTISYDKDSAQIKYRKLYRFYETDDFFYLYINKDHAFLLDKSTFCIGDISNFMSFLKKKCWLRIFYRI